MKNTFANKHAAIAVALALGAVSSNGTAQDTNETGLLKDSGGAQVMSGFGLCVHTGFGPAPAWTAGCHVGRPVPVAQFVAPAAEPAPIAAAAYEKVVFDANVLFDSNKSDLRPAGRETLDRFVGDISGLESQSVMAIGYADRMGTEGSNQVLSEERVGTVKAYLVGKGVAPERIKTSGFGEMRPTTRALQCEDANNQKNVACMQPDRHVFIEVSGTRQVK